jgi:ubiquinone/menaquinone biosynthesis C-methylase UbiE
MSLSTYIAHQFAHPTGMIGQIIMTVSNRQNRKLYNKTIDLLNVTKNDTILDIGFGNGFMLRQIAELKPEKLFGVDISEDMLHVAQRKNALQIKSRKMELLLANAENLPFKNDFFDKIYTVNTVYFWNDFEKTVAEIRRVLKHNGVFLNTFYERAVLERLHHSSNDIYRKFTTKELKNRTEQGGFSEVKMLEIEKGIFSCIFAKNNKIW